MDLILSELTDLWFKSMICTELLQEILIFHFQRVIKDIQFYQKEEKEVEEEEM